MSTDVALFGFDCGECGHHHAGQTFAYICVGCSCTNTGDGNQHERDLRGDPVADRGQDAESRDKSLDFSRAEAAEQQVKELTPNPVTVLRWIDLWARGAEGDARFYRFDFDSAAGIAMRRVLADEDAAR